MTLTMTMKSRSRGISILSSCFLLQQQHAIPAASSSSSSSSSPANRRRETVQARLEAARYSTLPPTVFAPGGRLHGVERVAEEALQSFDGDDGATIDEDAVSCGVLALHCGFRRIGGNDDDGEFAVMAGIGATSPFLHRDEAYWKRSSSDGTIDDFENDVGETYLPLTIDETSVMDAAPISILSPTLIAGTGGKAIDSTILLRRAIEAGLSMYSNDNGGVDWFISHSLEGIDTAPSSSRPSTMGGAAGVDAASLARRVADMAQSSTQSLGGRYGRMLSSSLLAVGARSPLNVDDGTVNVDRSSDDDTLVIWRVDPTGQFWRLDASAVGRGAVSVESALSRRVRSWKLERMKNTHGSEGDDDSDESKCDILHEDVRAYLGNLSVEEAVELATNCLVDGILARRKRGSNLEGQDRMMLQVEQGLRKRVQTVVIRSNSFGRSQSPIEVF